MKQFSLTFSFILIFSAIYCQEQVEEPFSYKVNGLIYFYKFDLQTQEPTDKMKIPKEGLKFQIVRNHFNESDNSLLHVVKFLDIIDDTIIVEVDVKLSLKGNVTYINSEDNGAYYWIRKDQFDKLLEDKFVTISYQIPNTQLTYGASLTLPFKYRTKTKGQNIKITPDITLGGFLGARHRISSTKPFYLSLPIVTLGMTTLAINDNNNPSDPDKGDGLVLGITASTGMVFEFDDFQFGLILGLDRAAGELGKDWIYNDKVWYSFSIGYTFLGRRDTASQQQD